MSPVVKNIAERPVDLSTGRRLRPAGQATVPELSAGDEALVNDQQLVVVTAGPAPDPEPQYTSLYGLLTAPQPGDVLGFGADLTIRNQEAPGGDQVARDAAAAAVARSSHTGVQPSSTISDLPEAVQDLVAAALSGTTGITVVYDDAAGTISIAGLGTQAEAAETARDTLGAALVATGLLSVVVNDATDTITFTTAATQNATDAALRDRGKHTGAQAQSTITGLPADLETKQSTSQKGVASGYAALNEDGEVLKADGSPVAGSAVDVAVLKEALPSVEQPEYAALAVGADWTPAFNALRTAVGIGGAFRCEHRLYELDNFTMLAMQRLEGQGPERTVLKAKAGAVRVVDMPGMIRHGKLKGVQVDGRGKLSEGSRLQGLNGTAGETSQSNSFEDVAWRNCSIGHRVAGTGVVPQSDQADKTIYKCCTIYNCDTGLRVDTVNGQQQHWIGGDIGSCIVSGVDLYGGGFTLIGGQMQMPALGVGTMVRFLGPIVDRVVFIDAMTEGWLHGLDSTAANCWPLNGVQIYASTIQIHGPGGGKLAVVDRGGVATRLTARDSTLNGGPIELRGSDTLFVQEHCNGDFTVTQPGVNTRRQRLKDNGWDDGIGKVAVTVFGPTWANQGSGYAPLTYERTLHGTVRIEGTIVSGGAGAAANNLIATLPAGYRPAATVAQIAGTGVWATNGIIVAVDGTLRNNLAVGAGTTLFVNMEFAIR
jgi:hypothetical protein